MGKETPIPTHKTCCDCSELLPIEMFARNKTARDRRAPFCTNCRKKYYEAQKETIAREAQTGNLFPCKECKRNLPADYFYPTSRKDPYVWLGGCVECRYMAAVSKRLKEPVHRLWQALRDQNDCCDICKKPFKHKKSRYADHCPTSGFFRAFLCKWCNMSLGHAQESPFIIRRLAARRKAHDFKNLPGLSNGVPERDVSVEAERPRRVRVSLPEL